MFIPIEHQDENLIRRKTSRVFDKQGQLLGNAKVSMILKRGDSLIWFYEFI